eukprot:Skav225375  [mRNA]  locus=scaffold329:320655:321666:+ [translate_table: standard]
MVSKLANDIEEEIPDPECIAGDDSGMGRGYVRSHAEVIDHRSRHLHALGNSTNRQGEQDLEEARLGAAVVTVGAVAPWNLRGFNGIQWDLHPEWLEERRRSPQ